MTVIAIIGILGTIMTISLLGQRVKGRDAQRVADLQKIRAALDQYAVDNGRYPISGSSPSSFSWVGLDPGNVVYSPTVATALKPYLGGAAPIDPSGADTGSNNDAGYIYNSNGIDYKIMSWRRPENMRDFDPSMISNQCGTITNGQCSSVNNAAYWTNGGNW
jgi:type II secretory pathway pseudopilin PulG